MATTYTPIATTTLGSAASNITFNSISATYTDLVIVISNLTTVSGSQTIYGELNADSTGTNYSNTILKGNGTSATSTRQNGNSGIRMFLFGYDAGTSTTNPTQIIWHLNNYSNTTTYKTGIARGDLASGEVNASVGLWRNTAAINSIKIMTSSANLSAGTTATIYGIKAA